MRLLIQRSHALEGAHAHVFQLHHQHSSRAAGGGYHEKRLGLKQQMIFLEIAWMKKQTFK